MKKLVSTFLLATLMATTALTQQVDAAPKKVKVTYVENGGKTVKDQKVNKKTNPKEPSISRTGYVFKGWYTDKKLTKKWDDKSSKVTKNTTLYAKWQKGYKVTYVENGGKAVKDQTVNKNGNPKEPKITRNGYSFVGWYTDKKLTKKWNTSSSKVTKNTTLYAKWTKANYTVTYDTGWMVYVNVPSSKVSYGTNLAEPTPKKSGYVFMGWYTDSNRTKAWDAKNGKVTKNMTLYGKWDYEVKASDFEITNGILMKYNGMAENVTIPNGVTRIAEDAFFLSNVKYATLPSSVTSIAKNAFQYSDLVSINIPSKVTSIGNDAFGRNNPVLKITNNSYASKWAYENGYRHTINGGSIKNGVQHRIEDNVYVAYYGQGGVVTIPNGVRTIGEYAFKYNEKITSIKLSSSVKYIEEGAFWFTPNLTSVTMPEGVEQIESFAFCGSGITTLDIPSTITYISEYAFYDMNLTLKIKNNTYAVNWAKENGFKYYHNGVYGGKSLAKPKPTTNTTVEDNTVEENTVEKNAVKEQEVKEPTVQKEEEQVSVDETTNEDTKIEADTSEEQSAVEDNEVSNDVDTDTELNDEQ